jgi:hypothetical protein
MVALIGKRWAMQIESAVVELCIDGAVANRSPSAAGLANRHSQQSHMIKSVAALAISGLPGVPLREVRLTTARR